VIVGLRREGILRAKGHCGVGTIFRRPKFMRRRSPEGLPELAASFDPHESDVSEFVERSPSRRDQRSREKRSSAPSPESEIDEKQRNFEKSVRPIGSHYRPKSRDHP
jgi:hypothetical protein